jgi:hypothetical protein
MRKNYPFFPVVPLSIIFIFAMKGLVLPIYLVWRPGGGRKDGGKTVKATGPVHLAYNPSYSACFFSQNSIFLSQKISQQCFSAGL